MNEIIKNQKDKSCSNILIKESKINNNNIFNPEKKLILSFLLEKKSCNSLKTFNTTFFDNNNYLNNYSIKKFDEKNTSLSDISDFNLEQDENDISLFNSLEDNNENYLSSEEEINIISKSKKIFNHKEYNDDDDDDEFLLVLEEEFEEIKKKILKDCENPK